MLTQNIFDATGDKNQLITMKDQREMVSLTGVSI